MEVRFTSLPAALAVAVLLAAQLPVAPPAAAQPTDRAADRAADPAAVFAGIDGRFERFARETPVPGLVYGIVMDGRLTHVRGFGVQDLDQRRPVRPDSLFRIASMSKAFTALAILRLRDAGRLRLDDLAEQHVPELRAWRYPTTDSPRIRVRDLLSHAGGFVTDDPWGDRQQVLSEADFTAMLRAGVPFTRTPQLSFEYSNFGYALLGRIVTNASGRPYKDYIEQELMRPLGMMATGYEIGESPPARRAIGYRWENEAWAREPDMRHGTFGAMGGVQTSAQDYARWIAFLLSAWPARDEPDVTVARRATVREMAQGLNFPFSRPRFGSTGAEACRQAATYAMGLIAAADCDLGMTLSHGGGYPGYGSHMLLLADHSVGIFVFTNRTYTGASGVAWDAAADLHRAGLLRGRAVPVSAALAETYAAARAMYAAGSVEPGRGRLAVNFLMDRSPENWAREFTRLRGLTGVCNTDAPIRATGALAGQFDWRCERGRLEGGVLLAPTDPPSIQALRFRVVPPAP